jgi:hypothetical protein
LKRLETLEEAKAVIRDWRDYKLDLHVEVLQTPSRFNQRQKPALEVVLDFQRIGYSIIPMLFHPTFAS